MRTQRQMELEILTVSFATLVVLLLQHGQTVESFGYSYSRFIGPVRGPERQIIVHDRHDGRGRVDYVARPEYQFAYGVEDAKTRVLQNRRETRNGDAVKGVYSVVDPDGSLRVVKYTADNVNGFQAEVISNGVSRIHGQDNPVVHPAQSVVAGIADGNQVNAKDNNNQHLQQIQVQHPEEHDATVEGKARGKATPDEEDTNNESSDSKDASDEYDETDDDGGKSASRNESEEQEDSEEVEDY